MRCYCIYFNLKHDNIIISAYIITFFYNYCLHINLENKVVTYIYNLTFTF